MHTDYMRLAGGPILIAALLMAGARDLGPKAIALYGPAWQLGTGAATAVMAIAALQLVAVLSRGRAAGRSAERTWMGRAVRATSRLALGLALCVAGAGVIAGFAGP